MIESSMDDKERLLFLAGIATDSIVDGPGLRVTLFAQGCPRRCRGCHNPDTHSFEGGTAYTIAQLLAVLHKNPLARGVTFSGGEPFSQAEGFAQLAQALRAEGYEMAAYTGNCLEALLSEGSPAQKQLLQQLDILIDGEFLLAQCSLDLRWRGSANQRILSVPQSLAAGQAIWTEDARWR